MDQRMSTQLSTKLSECCSALEHKSGNGTKDRSRRQRKVSQRFLNIYKNSEMSYIDRQVKKLSTMDDKNDQNVQTANALEEADPNHHVDTSSTSSGDSAVLPVDPCSTSCMSGNAIGAIVHRYLKSKPKQEEVPSSHSHSKQCCRSYSGKVMSVFKGRRGRPPKPLWVRLPRAFLTLTQDMEMDSYSRAKLLESNTMVPESSLVGQKALYMCKPSPVTTSPSPKPVACVSSGDCHPENHELRNRPPLKKRRVDMLDVDTPSTHHSYCFSNSVYSSFKDICVGFGDTAQFSAVSVYPSSVPLCAEKEHCSEKQDECGAMETTITNANRIGEVRSSCVQSGLTETSLACTASTAQRECKDVYLSSSTHAVSLQSVVPHAVSAVQDQHQDAIPTDSLSVSISKETLGTLWHSLNTKAPTVVVENKNVLDTTMDHESRSTSSFIADGTLEKNSSLVVSVPVTPIHSPSNCHSAKEGQNSVCGVSLAEVSSTLQMASTVLQRPLDNPKRLPVHQDCRTVKCSTTTDAICDKSCTTLIDDGYLHSSCTDVEAVSCTQPNGETTQEQTPDRAHLVQFPSICAGVDGESSILTDHCHNSFPASANRHVRDTTHLAMEGARTTPPNVLDDGNFNPCLIEVYPLLTEGRDASSQPAEHNEPRHECIRCNFGEDSTNPQKFCQPWQPAADAVPAHHQEAVRQLIHKMPFSSEADFPVDPCSSTNTASVVEACNSSQIDGSCAPNGHHPITSNLTSCTAAIGDRSCVYKEAVDATQIGTGDGTLFANEDLNSSTESKVEEGESITKVPIQADPSFNNDGHNIKVMRPQREQARRKRNEKAFLYDENLVDLILAEHEPLLPPFGKNSLKSVKEDKASAVASKPHLRRRGIVKASKQKDANETSSSEAEQSKGKGGKMLPFPKLKGSLVERKQKLSAGKRKWEVGKDGRKNDKKGSWACKGAKTACRYDTKGKDKAGRESASTVKLALPKVVPSSKGKTCTMTSIMDAKGDNVRVKSKLVSEGKQPVLVAKENRNQSILEPPPPRSRNYWRTAQAWLPRKVPEARQDVIALRQKSQDMQCRAVSKLHLEENNGWRWLGDPISVSKYMLKGKQIIRSYFIGMRRGRKQTEDLLARDCVLVFSGDVNKFPYVGRIVSLWQDSGSDEMMFTTAWYHRPADVLGSKSDENYDERELFASSHRDDNPVASIMCKCFVIGYNEYCRFRAAYSCSQSMAKCSLADALVPNPSPHHPVNFHIPAANSKIDLSHVFYCKNSLLSARHHTNRMKTDQRMRLKYMQKGVKPH